MLNLLVGVRLHLVLRGVQVDHAAVSASQHDSLQRAAVAVHVDDCLVHRGAGQLVHAQRLQLRRRLV